MITRERLKDLLYYDPVIGTFTWVETRGPVKKGAIAGSLNSIGYIQICIDKQLYSGHRLAFLYIEGEFPPHEVDHIDGSRSNNRWSNLRRATKSQNAKNAKKRVDNTSGITGVRWIEERCRWYAQIGFNGKIFNLGYHKDIADAIKARETAEVKYGFHPNHGRRE